MIKRDYIVHTQSRRMPDGYTGSSDLIDATDAFYTRLAKTHSSLLKRLQSGIKATEKRYDKTAIDISYLTGFESRDGAVYLVVKASFALRQKLRAVK